MSHGFWREKDRIVFRVIIDRGNLKEGISENPCRTDYDTYDVT